MSAGFGYLSVASALLAAPLGNHLVVVRGHHRSRLTRWLTSTRPPADQSP